MAGRRGGDERGRAGGRAAWIRPFDVVPVREALEKGPVICLRAMDILHRAAVARGVVLGESRDVDKRAALLELRDAGTPAPGSRTTRPVLSGDAARKRTYAGRKIFLLRCTP